MPQELVDGICVIWDPLAPHQGAFVHDSFFSGPGVCVKLHDYFWIIFCHRFYQLCPTLPSNFGLEFHILPPASWTRLSLRKDQSLITSKRHWCSWLRKRCPSNSISACGTALDPSPAVVEAKLYDESLLIHHEALLLQSIRAPRLVFVLGVVLSFHMH